MVALGAATVAATVAPPWSCVQTCSALLPASRVGLLHQLASLARQPVVGPWCRPAPTIASAAHGGAEAARDAGPVYAAASGLVASAWEQPASRLQQEVELLVALDVEYTHLALLPGGRHISLPAEMCVVDASGRVLLYEHCNPLEGALLQGQRWHHVGGISPATWHVAAPLREMRALLAALLVGRILVGHHLAKDLRALEMEHPAEDLRDTLRYRELQGRHGSGRTLRQLSAEKLGRDIQRSGRRHSPREDAQAAMDLYLQHIHFDKRYMRYDDLVQHHLVQILGSSESGV